MKKLVLFILLSFEAVSQDFLFSNVESIPQFINPGVSGLNEDFKVSLSYRNQWKSISTPFVGYYGEVSAKFMERKSKIAGHLGGGISFLQQQMSPISKTFMLNANLNYHLKLTKYTIWSVGVNGGCFGLSFEPINGKWASQHDGDYYDPMINSGERFVNYSSYKPDVGASTIYTVRRKNERSALAQTPIFQAGYSIQHLNQQKLTLLENGSGSLRLRQSGFAALSIPISNIGSYIKPLLIYQIQGEFNSIQYGAHINLLLWEKAKFTSTNSKTDAMYLHFGVFNRVKDACVFQFGVERYSWVITFTYDMTISKLQSTSYSHGAFEMALQMKIPSYKMNSRY